MLSILLCIAMIVVYSVPVFAATENNESQTQASQGQTTEQESVNTKSETDNKNSVDISDGDAKTEMSSLQGTDNTDSTEETGDTEDTWPKTGEAGENATWSLDGSGAMTIAGTGDMTGYEDGTSMPWNEYKSQITSVTIEKGITKIGQHAFDSCTNLASVTISSDGESLAIDKYAFYKCTSLNSIDLPERVASLEYACFGECGSIEITIRNDSIYLGYKDGDSFDPINFFLNSNVLIRCNTPSKALTYVLSVTYKQIWGGTLNWECITHNWDTEYTIDKEATPFAAGSKSIHCKNGSGAGKCNSKKDVQEIAQLKNVSGTIGDLTWTLDSKGELDITGTGEMPDYTESGLSVPPWNKYKDNITEVYVENTVTNVGAYAFANCKSLKTINLNVKKIGEGALYNCDSLTTISILKTVTEIDTLAYAGCDSLTKVKFPQAADAPDIDIKEDAFKDSSNVEFACNPNTSASEYADKYNITWRCYSHTWETNDDGSDKYTIDKDATCTDDGEKSVHCKNCTYRKEVAAIPALGGDHEWSSEYTIDKVATSTEDGEKSIRCTRCNEVKEGTSTKIPKLAGVSGTVGDLTWQLDGNGKLTITGLGAIPDFNSATTPWNDYKGCIESIEIGDGVTKVGKDAFREIPNLTTVIFPSSLTTIDTYAFYDCDKLTSVVLPANMAELGHSAFGSCDGLEAVTISCDIIGMDNNAFKDSRKLALIRCNPDSKAETFAKEHNIKWECINHTWDTYEDGTDKYTTDVEPTFEEKGSESIHCTKCDAIKEGSTRDMNPVTEYSGSVNTDITWKLTKEGVLTIEGTGEMPDYNKTAAPWKKYNSYIKSIQIGEGITKIGKDTFRDIDGLTKVSLPSTLTIIDTYAFYNCDGITEIELPSKLGELGHSAFGSCDKLEAVSILNDDIGMDDNAFRDSKNVVIRCNPNTTVSKYATKNNIKWECFTHEWNDGVYTTDVKPTCMDDGSESIHCKYCSISEEGTSRVVKARGYHTYSDAWSLDKAPTKTTAGQKSHHCTDCDAIDESSITEIPKLDGVDGGSDGNIVWSIEEATSSDSDSDGTTKYVLTIDGGGDMKDYNDNTSKAPWRDKYEDSIVSVVINDSVSSIGSYAFRSCGELTSVTIGSGVTKIGSRAFADCGGLTSIVLPSNVSSIAGNAFFCCTNLAEVAVYNDEILIDSYAFYNCNKLTFKCNCNPESNACKFAKNKDKKYYCLDDNHVYNEEWTTDSKATCKSEGKKSHHCLYCKATKDETTIPVTDHTWYKHLIADKEATDTEDGEASIHCRVCGEIKAGSKVTIPKYTKSGKTGNLSYKLDDNGVLTITGNGEMPEYTDYPYAPWYYFYKDIKEVKIESGVKNVSCGALVNCSNLTKVTLPNTITNIGEAAFADCTSLSEIALPNSLTSIGEYAFAYCPKLSEITLPNSLRTIGDGAFEDCAGLTEITLPNSLTSVGEDAFAYCMNLATVTIENDNIDIDEDAFYDANEDLVIRCNPNSNAWKYADENDYEYQCIHHTMKNPVIDKEPTCTEDGSETGECEACGYSGSATIPATGHSWKSYISKAGYLKNGTSYSYCTVCKAKTNVKTLAGYSKYIVKSLKVKKGKKSFKVSWKKATKANKKVISGYQIRYSNKSSMASSKYVKASKSSKSKTIKKLSGKTKYYVQVRNYMTKSGKTYYSKWSTKKSVKTK